jgi:hypothetical protein
VITASSLALADQARPRAGLVCASSRQRSNVRTETPTSRDTAPTAALSGGNNRATTLFLNASPYRAIFHPYRPQFHHHKEATTILTRRAVPLHGCQKQSRITAMELIRGKGDVIQPVGMNLAGGSER